VPIAVTWNIGGTAITIGVPIETPKTIVLLDEPAVGNAAVTAVPTPATTGVMEIAIGVLATFKNPQ
jgi:hypothetical protein